MQSLCYPLFVNPDIRHSDKKRWKQWGNPYVPHWRKGLSGQITQFVYILSHQKWKPETKKWVRMVGQSLLDKDIGHTTMGIELSNIEIIP